MPKAKPKRFMRKKRYFKKNRNVNKLGTVPRSKTYGFSRTRENLLALESPSDGWTTTLDNAVVKTVAWNLAELPAYNEFVNLFDKYKLNYCRMRFYPSYSTIASTTGAVAATNYVITVWPNLSGTPLTAAFDQTALNQIQRKRQWMFPMDKPTSINMYLKQAAMVYASTINTDYVVQRPKYLSTLETGTPHYGMNIHIRKVDGSSFGTNSARLLIKEKVYLTTKQVK